MSARYIEFTSGNRNRKVWPLASEFEMLISQSGRNSITSAVDPVSDAMPLFSWTSNNLILGSSSSIPVPPNINTANIATPSSTNPVGYTTTGDTFIISTTGPPQQLSNYYYGLVIQDTNPISSGYRRIATSTYIGTDSTGRYRTQITLLGGFSDAMTYGDRVFINDPTDLTDPSNPQFFVPRGQFQDNAYNGYILYNETANQYRPILKYDGVTALLSLDTTHSTTSTNSSGPTDSQWLGTYNYSIRKQPPTIPALGTPNPTIISTTVSSVTTTPSVDYSTLSDAYKNFYLRILPYGSTVSPTDTSYEYDPTPSNNKAYQITGFDPTSSTFFTTPPFLSVPAVGSLIEVLPFSYDNFNPFVYTGSLVSQQDMVCYEIQLVSITMPNANLVMGRGGRLAFYPYVYVQISNVSSSGAGLKNIIYSNNPNSTSVIFRAQIYDIQNPLNTPFVRVDGGGMAQIIKFKPNDNLYFKVTLGCGDTIQTVLEEYYSPSAPNPLAQVSAMFSFRRVS